ncbi:multidrug resistance efflux transporter family protein [Chungangia koreensis]|uniref:Multidrug resistance efflux transporter family protein n=1 Tax=Chungangia koreensis TaxID=752657 RepID=A0ABV8X771_9LACT
MREISLGLLASLFFAVTFVLNRSMELSGGSWLWSSSLRFLFMLPFLLLIVTIRNGTGPVFREIKEKPLPWLSWSIVAFVLFYAPLTFASGYSPGWLVAGTWQLTIIAGVLLAPFFFVKRQTMYDEQLIRQQIPVKSLLTSLIILVGVVLIQLPNAQSTDVRSFWLGVLPVVVAAFAYPLGNRKMMEICGGRLDPFQRVLGMTLMTIPIWLIFACYALVTVGVPSSGQVIQSLIVAISSGVIATTLFFMATDRVKDYQGKLAAVEATQSTELLFAIMGEMILLSLPLPGPIALVGIVAIVIGMSIHSMITAKEERKKTPVAA